MRLHLALTQYSDKYLTQLAGALYDAIKSERVKPGFTVADILHAGVPMLTNSLLAAIALHMLIRDGVVLVKKQKGEYRYYLKYPCPTAYVPDQKEPLPEQKEVEPPTEEETEQLQELAKEKAFPKEKVLDPHNAQVGGTHYVDMAIQPVEYIQKNNLGFLEGCVVKYVSRWKAKNGIEDLKKARHCLDMLIEEVDEID